MIVTQPNSGKVTIKHNGFLIATNTLKPATIFLMSGIHTAEGIEYDPKNIEDFTLGYWLPFSQKDKLSIDGSFSGRTTSTYSISYSPNKGWGSSMNKPVFEDGEPRKYDAWLFSEDQLIDDVSLVLSRKASCQVALNRGYGITIQRWKPEPDAELMPMEIALTDKIIVNFTHAPEILHHQAELKERSDAYNAAARAGGSEPKIHLRYTPKANDRIFRKTLLTLSKSGIRTIQLEDQRKTTQR
ncbi:hypothetical protein [Oceaniferula spumae]